jgi:prevent-host-death family protein
LTKELAVSQVNMLEAKTHLSRLVEAVESGAEKEIIIARNGKPAARLVPVEEKPKPRVRRLGLLDGKFPVMSQEEFDADNELIRQMFEDGRLFPDEKK